MSVARTGWVDRLAGLALGVLALVVYGLTLGSGACPGESARLIVHYTGLFPRLTPFYPLWGALVWLLQRIPIASVPARLNLFSALCAAAAVGLLYHIVSGAVYAAIDVNSSNEQRARVAARLAGAAAGLFLAFCIPFWIVANRAHTASLHVLLLLTAAWLFMAYARTGSERFALVFAFLYGLGIVEFATFIVFAPLFAVGLAWVAWKRQMVRAGPIVRIVVCGLIGLSLYLVAAWGFHGTMGYELREYPNFFRIIWFMWRDQYLLISRSLPRVGWMIIVFVTFVPWVTALGVSRRALNEEKDWAYYLLHAVMTGLAVATLLDTKIAPWRMLGFSRLLVTPYVLSASLFGYLVAYWFLLPTVWWQDAEDRARRWIRLGSGPLMAVLAFVVLFMAPLRNLPTTDARSSNVVRRYAEQIVKSLSGCPWLVTDGTVDDHLLLVARELGVPLRVVNLPASYGRVYAKYLATLFEAPRLKNAAEMGGLVLLQEWFRADPDITQKVAILSNPDLWVGSGFTYVPHLLVFHGTKDPSQLDTDALMAEHEEFWRAFVPFMKGERRDSATGASVRKRILRHAGFVANNLGVLMEDLGHKEAAYRAYIQAWEIDPGNISALLNLSVMIGEGFPSKDAEAIDKAVRDLAATVKERYHIWSLSRHYGYVRMPQAFAQLGWTWALSGQPNLAVARLKKAMALLPDGSRGHVKQVLADVYLAQREDEQSEALYRELLQEEPENRQAFLGLARIAARKEEFVEAEAFLSKAAEAGVPDKRISIERANLLAMQGDTTQSKTMLLELVKAEPDAFQAWSMLIALLARENDEAGLEECVRRLRNVRGGEVFHLSAASGHLALVRRDLKGARHHFERALALNPKHTQILEVLLRLDVLEGNKPVAKAHVRDLLRVDADNAFGNYVLGSLKLEEGEDAMAEDLFRRSLRRQRAPFVLNDLAWVLQKQGAFAEAEKLAREAAQIDADAHQSWDTLGVILMGAGRLDEAEKALERSLTLYQDDLSVFLHMAELQSRRGNRKRALDIVQALSGKQGQLSPQDQKRLMEVRAAISR